MNNFIMNNGIENEYIMKMKMNNFIFYGIVVKYWDLGDCNCFRIFWKTAT